MIEKIKRYYDLGIYKDKHLLKFVEKNVITQKEYEQIKEEK
jgi:uncharacterized XkdX family phage protein